MSKLNLKSLIRWGDFHFINHPTTMKFLKKYFLIFLFFLINSVTLFFISWVPVIYCLLPIQTLFFLYESKYREIFTVWLAYFITWYLLFTACLFDYDAPINIGGYQSEEIFNHLYFKYLKGYCYPHWSNRYFRRFCVKTFIVLEDLSFKIGYPIYIPCLFKYLLKLLKSLTGG